MYEYEEGCDFGESEHRIIGYCENCGLEIRSNDDALCVIANGDLLHPSCWEMYASEHAETFTVSADTERRAIC